MILIARFFRFLFRFQFFKKRYFGIYNRIIRPLGLFKNTELTTVYDKTLKIKLRLRDWIQQQIYFFGFYDERGILFIKSHLKSGDTFIDIGGNIGAYTLIAAKIVAKKGSVIAFEPVSRVRNRLMENVQLNNFQQVLIEPLAVFDSNTELELHISNEENFGMSSIHAHDENSGITEKVKAIRLDDYLLNNEIRQVDLIKIDIEGAELFALKGMKTTLEQFKPIVLIEISPDVLDGTQFKSEEIYAFFEAINYTPFCVREDGSIYEFSTNNVLAYTNFVFIALE